MNAWKDKSGDGLEVQKYSGDGCVTSTMTEDCCQCRQLWFYGSLGSGTQIAKYSRSAHRVFSVTLTHRYQLIHGNQTHHLLIVYSTYAI